MLKLVKVIFRNYLEMLLWFNFVFCVIVGAIIGRSIAVISAVGNTFNQLISAAATGDMVALTRTLFFPNSGGIGGIIIGLLVGAIIGFWVNIIYGGYLVTILNMSKDIALLRKERIGSLSENSSTDYSGSLVDIVADEFKTMFSKFKSNSFRHYKECPFCANRINKAASVCQHCRKDLPLVSHPPEDAAHQSCTDKERKLFCTRCGNKIDVQIGEKFCTKCGNKI